MQDRVIGGSDAGFEHVLDQDDAAARSIAFVAEQHVGGTGRGADAAMDAGAQVCFRFREMRIGQLRWREIRAHQTPAHIRPGLSSPSGSKAAFTARVS